jgi:predicted short-subunit dehydrogenase-like oxidoreductase (DUF2520 family)
LIQVPVPTDGDDLISVSIIGAGRLGTSLGAALRTRGYQIHAVSCRTRESAEESRGIIGSGRPLTDNRSAASGSRLVFLTVPDDSLPGVVDELAGSREDRSGVCFLHTSGLLTSRVLEPLARQGANTGSLHPMQSFADKRTPPDHFSGIYFGMEGDARALVMAKQIIEDLDGYPLALSPEDKPLVHTACTIASNLLVPLLHQAGALLQATGISHSPVLETLLPLAQGTLQNVKKLDSTGALTGPIKRGDLKTIKSQLKVLQTHPEALRIYRELGKAALDMAREEGSLSREILARLNDLLEDR